MWSSSVQKTSLLFFCITLFRGVTAPAKLLPHAEDHGIVNAASHNTTLGQVLPAAFSTVAGIVSGPDLSKTSCLLQLLVAIAQTATEDFGVRQPSISFTHPVLVITLEGRRQAAAIDRKFAIWGLYGAMSHMVSHNDFHARMFTLRWQGSIVGRIRFEQRIYLQINGGNTGLDDVESPAENANLSSLVKTTTTAMKTTLEASFADGELEYYIYLMGQTIAESDVYMTVATALVQAAPIPAAAPIHTFDVDAGAFNSHLRIANLHNPPHNTPPFLSQRNMVKVLIQIPALMLIEEKRWGEANVEIRVDKAVVASGMLRRVYNSSQLQTRSRLALELHEDASYD